MRRPFVDTALLDNVRSLSVQIYQISGFWRLPHTVLDSGTVYLRYPECKNAFTAAVHERHGQI